MIGVPPFLSQPPCWLVGTVGAWGTQWYRGADLSTHFQKDVLKGTSK